ncbi:PrgI family protein [Candidatus Saccharibacteria bacterium oral taxon 955]
MKTTVVPAQVTTVEDRIIGKLGFSQIVLLMIPVFLSAGIFTLLPPVMNGALHKYVLMALSLITCGILSIRVKGKIIALWLVTVLRYNLRPKYYLFDKNTTAFRNEYKNTSREDEEVINQPAKKQQKPEKLDDISTIKTRQIIDDPTADVRFETDKKGGLHVRFTKVKR